MIDGFVWKGDGEPIGPGDLIRTESRYFPPIVGDFGDLWHVHVGYFSQYQSAMADLNNCRMLNRVHIDSSLRGGQHQVRVDHTLRLDLLQDLVMEELQEREFVDQLNEVFTSMHLSNKNVMKDVLVDEMQTRISLND